jgi:cytoskeletal protein CcmA (bactofilin family)
MNTRPPIATLTPTASEAPRRPADFLQPLARRVDQRPMTNQPQVQDQRKLTVSRGITVAGELTGCAKLVVEGRVEARLHDCMTLEIAEHGSFDGKAEVETCEVKGTVEGELTVRGRLVIRATGRVLGKVRYLDLHIEPGGKLAGQIEALDAPTEVRPLDSAPGAPRFTLAQSEASRPDPGRSEPSRPAISVLQPLELTDMAEEPLRGGPGLTADRG